MTAKSCFPCGRWGRLRFPIEDGFRHAYDLGEELLNQAHLTLNSGIGAKTDGLRKALIWPSEHCFVFLGTSVLSATWASQYMSITQRWASRVVASVDEVPATIDHKRPRSRPESLSSSMGVCQTAAARSYARVASCMDDSTSLLLTPADPSNSES